MDKSGVVRIFLTLLFVLHLLIYDQVVAEDFTPIDNFYGYVDKDDNYTRHDFENLINNIKIGYNRLARPALDYTKPVIVKCRFILSTFRELNEVQEKFSVGVFMNLQWIDDRIAWNPEDYGGLKTFIIENEAFWTPMLILTNAFEKFEKFGEHDYWPVRFLYTGLAMYEPGALLTATCSIDVTNYPWDEQRCSLLFGVMTHMTQEVQLSPMYEKVNMAFYTGHSEWDITDAEVVTIFENVAIEVKFIFRRKPLFVFVNVVLPIIFLSAMNTLVFLIPVEAGERYSYCVTVLLAIAVFLTIVSDSLPKSSKHVPVLCYYLVSLLVFGILILNGLTISMRVFFIPEEEKVPSWCARLVLGLRCRSFNLKKHGNDHIKDKVNDKVHASCTDRDGHKMQRAYSNEQENQLIDRIESGEKKSDKGNIADEVKERTVTEAVKHETPVTWRDFSYTLDMLFFTLSWLVLTVLTATYFAYVIR